MLFSPRYPNFRVIRIIFWVPLNSDYAECTVAQFKERIAEIKLMKLQSVTTQLRNLYWLAVQKPTTPVAETPLNFLISTVT